MTRCQACDRPADGELCHCCRQRSYLRALTLHLAGELAYGERERRAARLEAIVAAAKRPILETQTSSEERNRCVS